MVSWNASREWIMRGKLNFLANSACSFKAFCWTSMVGFSGKWRSIPHSQMATIWSLFSSYNSSNSSKSGKKSDLLWGISHGCRQMAVFKVRFGKSFIDSLDIWIHFPLYSLFAQAFTTIFHQIFSKFSKYFL